MAEIVIFRYTPDDGPGYLSRFLLQRGLRHRVIAVDRGHPIPRSADAVSGVALMGGPQSVNDALPWIPGMLDFIRQAIARDIPVLGHCLGGQLIAAALGGHVGPSRVKEVGWHPLRQVKGPGAERWLAGLEDEFIVFQWHRESFTLPQGAELILTAEGCENQGFVVGRSLALQCHIEMLADMVRDWASSPGEEEGGPGDLVQSPEQMLEDLEQRVRGLHQVADTLYARWAQGLR